MLIFLTTGKKQFEPSPRKPHRFEIQPVGKTIHFRETEKERRLKQEEAQGFMKIWLSVRASLNGCGAISFRVWKILVFDPKHLSDVHSWKLPEFSVADPEKRSFRNSSPKAAGSHTSLTAESLQQETVQTSELFLYVHRSGWIFFFACVDKTIFRFGLFVGSAVNITNKG